MYPRCSIEEAPDNVMVLNGVDLTPITELAIDVKHVMVTPAPGPTIGISPTGKPKPVVTPVLELPRKILDQIKDMASSSQPSVGAFMV